jgi:hypothetical protein
MPSSNHNLRIGGSVRMFLFAYAHLPYSAQGDTRLRREPGLVPVEVEGI